MLIDIRYDLAILQSYFIDQVARTSTTYAQIQAHSEDDLEAELFAVNGPASIEALVCRMTISELNALIESSIQQAIELKNGSNIINAANNKQGQAEHIFALSRRELEERYTQEISPLIDIDGYQAVQEIKEICEGIKHRQRAAPTLKWKKSHNTLVFSSSLVLGSSDEWYRSYDLCFTKVSEYLASSKLFVERVLVSHPSAAM